MRSPLRSKEFVTKKIVDTAIKLKTKCLKLIWEMLIYIEIGDGP